VRIAILSGVVAPSLVAPAPYAQNGQRALESVLSLCESDAQCHAAYPDLRADYAAMLTRVADGVKINEIEIHRGLFGEVFRNFLYTPERYVRVPSIVHRAAHGDFQELRETALVYARSIRTLDFGAFLSVGCADDFSRLNVPAARKEAEGTLLGSYRVEQQAAACKIWPRGTADPLRHFPVRTSVPTLLLSGEFDPVTPPKYAEEVAKTLPSSLHVVVPKGGHYGDTGGCIEKIVVEAVKSGAVRELDVSCVEKIAIPKFRIEPASSTP
jgi:pimeloyl-ACP methyl ester carboxylesterase